MILIERERTNVLSCLVFLQKYIKICWCADDRAKTYPTSIFDPSIWAQINFVFWREHIPCLPPGLSSDDMVPYGVETSKRGVEISGKIWFLPTGCYDLWLCLSRPSFSSIESVTVVKLLSATVTEASLDDRTLKIVVSMQR